MDLQNIQDQLNTEFAKSETRIIFWFDDKGEYEDEVSELQLDDVKLHILDGTNWLYSKYLLNEEDKESKYLVYAAFAKPSDAENPLADMYYYSTPYYTDRVSQMSQEIGIDNRFKEHLSQYANFWKNKHRIEKFKELGIDHYNAQTIDIGLIAVLTDVIRIVLIWWSGCCLILILNQCMKLRLINYTINKTTKGSFYVR
jgi:hypothetical protein